MVGFQRDAAGHWVAVLGCGHPQHVRHEPPWTERPWVTTAAGRDAMLGEPLNCLRCERFEWPAGLIAYKQTPTYREDTLPAGLRENHSTRAGVWAVIRVARGALRYTVDAWRVAMDLSKNRPGIVVPEVVHRIDPQGSVRFHIAFYRVPDPKLDVGQPSPPAESAPDAPGGVEGG